MISAPIYIKSYKSVFFPSSPFQSPRCPFSLQVYGGICPYWQKHSEVPSGKPDRRGIINQSTLHTFFLRKVFAHMYYAFSWSLAAYEQPSCTAICCTWPPRYWYCVSCETILSYASLKARQDSASSEFDGYMSSPRAPRKLAVGMVGLPARGKTYMAQKLAYYLNWMQVCPHYPDLFLVYYWFF